MQRRQYLRALAAGSLPPTVGCLSLGGRSGPLDFAIVNRRERAFAVEFTLRDDADATVVDGAVDIAPKPPGEAYTALRFDDLARVTDGDLIDASVRVDGETFETTYEVTCTRSETAGNDLFFDIRHPDAPTGNGRAMAFRGSEC